MARKQDWQEDGVRIGGQVLDEGDARLLVDELQRRVKDPQITGEIEGFLKKDRPLSQRTRGALLLVVTGLMMSRPSGR
jgi:hypothetical protein